MNRDRWLKISKMCQPDKDEHRTGRESVNSTELTLAFPLKSRSELQGLESLQSLEVFAFLPLRSYGFRFLVQADWLVPSGREAVDHSSGWNDWLRSQIPDLFISAVRVIIEQASRVLHDPQVSDAEEDLQAVDEFGQSSSDDKCNLDSEAISARGLVGDKPTRSNAILLLDNLYAVIPAVGELVEYFHRTADKMIALLSGTRLILTGEGTFVTPSDAVLRPSDESAVRRTEGYLSLLGLRFVAAEVSLPVKVASALRVRLWDAKLLVDILSEALGSFAAKESSKSGKDGCHASERFGFLAWILGAISQAGSLAESGQLLRLGKLRFIPLANGDLTSTSEVVLLPNIY
jgi:hypothetical protein